MKEVITEINIDAPAEKVWAILTDRNNFANWNPLIVKMAGELKPNHKVSLSQIIGGKNINASPVLRNVDFPEFSWTATLFFKNIIHAHHYFKVEAISANKTHFVQGEIFSGILAPLVLKKFRTLNQDFDQMNLALKNEAEKANQDSRI